MNTCDEELLVCLARRFDDDADREQEEGEDLMDLPRNNWEHKARAEAHRQDATRLRVLVGELSRRNRELARSA